jgi:hypothetical protein
VGLFKYDLLPLLIAGIMFLYYIHFSFILSTTLYRNVYLIVSLLGKE